MIFFKKRNLKMKDVSKIKYNRIRKSSLSKELFLEIIDCEKIEIEYTDNFSILDKSYKSILKINEECFKEDTCKFLETALPIFLQEKKMRVFIIKHEGNIIGYASSQYKKEHTRLKDTKYYKEKVGYIAMCAILPKYQGIGLYRYITYIRIEHLLKQKAKNFFVRTQNPKVFLGIKKILGYLEKNKIIGKYDLEFTKCEKGTFKNEIISELNKRIDKPVEMEDIDIKNGDIGLYLWKIE